MPSGMSFILAWIKWYCYCRAHIGCIHQTLIYEILLMAKTSFGQYIRQERLALLSQDSEYSLRRVALSCGLEPSFLSKIERGIVPPPSEPKIKALAERLHLDSDVLLALAGKISSDLQDVIRMRPALFGDLIRQLKSAPDGGLECMAKEARAKYG